MLISVADFLIPINILHDYINIFLFQVLLTPWIVADDPVR